MRRIEEKVLEDYSSYGWYVFIDEDTRKEDVGWNNKYVFVLCRDGFARTYFRLEGNFPLSFRTKNEADCWIKNNREILCDKALGIHSRKSVFRAKSKRMKILIVGRFYYNV